ncbi:hypothetical protein [Burkholderia cepacia]|uniref:hypothetical protein n=1 Tax=Burkholderia cepacia TaxID=292 RepID=UPI00158E897C|nr:hypothetical protein [Burkholderia cepacia]
MFTMLRCSASAASFKISLKIGETRSFKVSLFVLVNRIGTPRLSVQLRYCTNKQYFASPRRACIVMRRGKT